jgi:hypothetical protein
MAQARRTEPVTEPAHPFGWHAAGDLPGLVMFDDARILISAVLAHLDRAGPGDAAAILRRYQVSPQRA